MSNRETGMGTSATSLKRPLENGAEPGRETKKLDRILLVEDDADIRTVAKMALESLGGYSVEPCCSGEDAIQKCADFAPDLVLLDVMMPGMDGPATLEEFRHLPELERTPVVFMTAKTQVHEVATLKELGALDVISKPFDPMSLASQVESIWRRAPTAEPANGSGT